MSESGAQYSAVQSSVYQLLCPAKLSAPMRRAQVCAELHRAQDLWTLLHNTHSTLSCCKLVEHNHHVVHQLLARNPASCVVSARAPHAAVQLQESTTDNV